MLRSIVLAIIPALLLALPATAGTPTAGEKAPPVEPKQWLNAPTDVSWTGFQGRLILVEKWATWCPPCRASIPHLNELYEKYRKKGFVILGISDEPIGKVKPFIENEVKAQYIIGIGGADGYKSPGIPNAWLVGPDGTIVWEGHPMNLKEGTIEENLKNVRLEPTFKLPRELASAQKLLDAGKYASALKELEKYLKKPKSEETGKAAQETIEAVKKYGDESYAEAESLGSKKEYGAALQKLTLLEKNFAGLPSGDQAKALKAKWKSDKEIKVEIAGAEQVEKARELIRLKKTKDAAAILNSVANGSKFKGTQIQEQARKELAKIAG